jgi:hypothetical protein
MSDRIVLTSTARAVPICIVQPHARPEEGDRADLFAGFRSRRWCASRSTFATVPSMRLLRGAVVFAGRIEPER